MKQNSRAKEAQKNRDNQREGNIKNGKERNGKDVRSMPLQRKGKAMDSSKDKWWCRHLNQGSRKA